MLPLWMLGCKLHAAHTLTARRLHALPAATPWKHCMLMNAHGVMMLQRLQHLGVHAAG
jgi:hypothetical protein